MVIPYEIRSLGALPAKALGQCAMSGRVDNPDRPFQCREPLTEGPIDDHAHLVRLLVHALSLAQKPPQCVFG